MLNMIQSMLLLLAIAASPDARMPAQLVGKYSNVLGESWSETDYNPVCDRAGYRYLVITGGGIDWGDGVLNPLIDAYPVSSNRFNLWIRENKTGHATLYAVIVSESRRGAITVMDERIAVQARSDRSQFQDAGVLGSYFRCAERAH